MRALGHERFAVVGHDRGGYVALRLALDHPDAVRALAVLDGVPIVEALARCDARFATAWWHWFFFAQPDKPAERVISADPDAWYRRRRRERMGAGGLRRLPRGPSTIRRPCTRCSRTTAPGWGSTARTTRPTGPPGGASPARRSSCGRSRDDLEELYGDPLAHLARTGPRTCAAARASSPATTWPRRRPDEVAASLLAFLGSVEDDVR